MVKDKTLLSNLPSYAADAQRGLACCFDVAMGVEKGQEISAGAHLCASTPLIEFDLLARNNENKMKFHAEEQHGAWPHYNATWREADPDDRTPL